MKLFKIAALLSFAIIIIGCEYKSKEELDPELFDDCPSENVDFTSHVLPILEQSCFSCHSAVNAPIASGIDFENTKTLREYANSGQLSGAIEHLDGYVPMPAEGPKLDSCSIDIINNWIENGSIINQ
jgi:hypothetical protein